MALIKVSQQSSLRRLLQALFRATDIVKLGYGVESDLRAIAAAIGGEGAGCIARVNLVVDLGILHKHLWLSGANVPRADGTGLAGWWSPQNGSACHCVSPSYTFQQEWGGGRGGAHLQELSAWRAKRPEMVNRMPLKSLGQANPCSMHFFTHKLSIAVCVGVWQVAGPTCSCSMQVWSEACLAFH
jgi:hypothetical protein